MKLLDVENSLLKEGRSFSFFQVIRLLKLQARKNGNPDPLSADNKSIYIKPELALNFPESDLESVTKREESEIYDVVATFLGLYGVASPLPTFYTEDLLDEELEARSVQRDFLDIIHNVLYPVFYDAWSKYNLFIKVSEEKDPVCSDRILSLIGLGETSFQKEAPEGMSLARYAGLLNQFPRSAMGLRAILGDFFGGVNVRIVQCYQRRVKIPADQTLHLGGKSVSLGSDSYLGVEMDDRMSAIKLEIGPMTGEKFHTMLPGSAGHESLEFLTRFYLESPLERIVEFIILASSLSTTRPGAKNWSRLGLDTWVFSGEPKKNAGAFFRL